MTTPETLNGLTETTPTRVLEAARRIRSRRRENESDQELRTELEAWMNDDPFSGIAYSKVSGKISTGRKGSDSWTSRLFDDDNDDAIGEPSISEKIQEQDISGFRAATGSEVPDMELQLQMEAARRRALVLGDAASAYIDQHAGADASVGEKFAMKMIPMQLPSFLEEDLSTKKKEGPESVLVVTPSKAGKRTGIETASGDDKHKKVSSSSTSSSATVRLTREEEIELATSIQEGARLHAIKSSFEEENGRAITRLEWTSLADIDSPSTLRRLVSTYRDAKNKLVTANMGLVYAVIRQNGYYKNKKDLSEEELVQEGALGLIRAAELFDPSRGLRFSTYATIWIKGVLGNSKVDQIITVPNRIKRAWKKVQDSTAELQALEGNGHTDKMPSVERIAKLSKLKASEVEDLQTRMGQTQRMLSLDHEYSSSHSKAGTSTTLYGSKAFQTDEDLAETIQLKADVVVALARNLDSREARLMRLRYGLKDGKMRSLVECAEMMGLSRSRVHTLDKECLKKLREAEGAESLQEYLLTVA